MRNIHLNIFEHIGLGLPLAKGKFLISEPFLPGPFFDRSIVYIVEHGKEGTIGYIINKPTTLYPDEIIKGLYNFSGELFIGGPKGATTINFVHNLGSLVPQSRAISSKISWSGDFNVIMELINLGMANAESVKFFLGYSVWEKGQLEDEIRERSWIVADLPEEALWNNTPLLSWNESMKGLGGIYKTWAKFPRNPSWN